MISNLVATYDKVLDTLTLAGAEFMLERRKNLGGVELVDTWLQGSYVYNRIDENGEYKGKPIAIFKRI